MVAEEFIGERSLFVQGKEKNEGKRIRGTMESVLKILGA
jgi:hypothetical protein